MQAAVARVPSTASTPDGTLRPRTFALLRWLEKSVPAGWRVTWPARRPSGLARSTDSDRMPITAAALMTEITCFLLELAPHLDLLDELGLTVPRLAAATPGGGDA